MTGLMAISSHSAIFHPPMPLENYLWAVQTDAISFCSFRLLNNLEQQEDQRFPLGRHLHQRNHPCDRSPIHRRKRHPHLIHERSRRRSSNLTAQSHLLHPREALQLNALSGVP
jgi:hypothetical protein